MSSLRMYVGAYTQDLGWVNGQATGIALYQLDPATGQMAKRSEVVADNPSYLALHPSGKFLFATNEATRFGPSSDNAISAFVIAEDGTLSWLNQQPSLGGAPCFVSTEPTGRFALTANYLGGNFVLYPISADGRLAEASDRSRYDGPATDRDRPLNPHAHSINLAPGGKYALGCDLGLDKIFVYKIDLIHSRLLPNSEAVVAGGSGPRHLAFHPSEKVAYVINELGGTITVFTWEDVIGQLSEIQTVPTVPADYTGPLACADVHVHPSGKFVYGSNRGHDSIVIYRVDQATGRLSLIGHEPTRGRTPRNFALTPDGSLLLAANQDSDTVVVFRVDDSTGQLTHLATNDIPTPVCLKFA